MLQCSFWSWIVTLPLHNVLHYGREILNILLAISPLLLREVFNSSFVFFLYALHCALFFKLSFHVYWSNAFPSWIVCLKFRQFNFLLQKIVGQDMEHNLFVHTHLLLCGLMVLSIHIGHDLPWHLSKMEGTMTSWLWASMIFHELKGPLQDFSL